MGKLIIITGKKTYYIDTKYKLDVDILHEILREYSVLLFDDVIINCHEVENIYIDSVVYLNDACEELQTYKGNSWKYWEVSFY